MSHTIFALCAEWCGVCREFRLQWDAAAAGNPQVRHVWIDIEDHADRLGDLDIETFPTIAIARGAQPLFFGTTLPSMPTVLRLLDAGLSVDALDAGHRATVAHLMREFAPDDDTSG
jgi:thioredoxin 1